MESSNIIAPFILASTVETASGSNISGTAVIDPSNWYGSRLWLREYRYWKHRYRIIRATYTMVMAPWSITFLSMNGQFLSFPADLPGGPHHPFSQNIAKTFAAGNLIQHRHNGFAVTPGHFQSIGIFGVSRRFSKHSKSQAITQPDSLISIPKRSTSLATPPS